jgi:hypothetical protein
MLRVLFGFVGGWTILTAKYNAFVFLTSSESIWGCAISRAFRENLPCFAEAPSEAEWWPLEASTQFRSALSEGNRKRPIAEIRRSPSRPFFITNKSDGQHRHAISHARQW